MIATNTGIKTISSENGDRQNVTDVTVAKHPLTEPTGVGNFLNFWGKDKTSDSIKFVQNQIKLALIAYAKDGLAKQSVDKHIHFLTDFSLKGGEKQVAYLEKRLAYIGLASGEPWKRIILRHWIEYFKVGTGIILKKRGTITPQKGVPSLEVKRILYKNKPQPIKSLHTVSVEKLQPAEDKDRTIIGWKPAGVGNRTVPSLLEANGKRFGDSLITVPSVDADLKDTFYVNGQDLLVSTYKQCHDNPYGISPVLTAVQDIRLLREIETSVAHLIKKNTSPLIHHLIEKSGVYANIQSEIQNVGRMYRAAANDGLLITGPGHSVTAVGSESVALRNEGYLAHFIGRCCSSLGVSPAAIGMHAVTLGAATAAQEDIRTTVRYCIRELTDFIEFGLINELLWEGGFNPFFKKEDRVTLEFNELDINTRIKLENHYADLYSKNFTTLGEARSLAGLPSKINLSQTYLNTVQVPLIKAEGAAKALTKSVPTKENIEPLLPQEEDQVEDFVLLMEKLYDVDRDILFPYTETITTLLDDRYALTEFVYNLLKEKN